MKAPFAMISRWISRSWRPSAQLACVYEELPHARALGSVEEQADLVEAEVPGGQADVRLGDEVDDLSAPPGVSWPSGPSTVTPSPASCFFGRPSWG